MTHRAHTEALENTVRRYAEWIHEDGERTNTCTYNVLREICRYCRCKRAQPPTPAAPTSPSPAD